MDSKAAIAALSALAQPTRLATYKLLVSREPEGLPAGQVADALSVPQNTMSAHLSVLWRAGLVSADRQSRQIVYRADIARLRTLMLFLAQDCCAGSPDLCAPLIAELAC